MIVRTAGDVLHLITQPDHAHLARRIMERCVALAPHPRRDSILHAIAEHDNGWIEPDASPTVDPETGGVADFVSAPLSVRHGVWPRAVSRLAADPWAAALVAQHAIVVYDRFRADAPWMAFFASMETLRDDMLRASGRPLDDLLADYPFLRLADLISLTFCTGWSDELGYRGWTVRLQGARLRVTPDPFGANTVSMMVEARTIPNRQYQTDEQLRHALAEAATLILRGEVAA
jgi:hypothetical protein